VFDKPERLSALNGVVEPGTYGRKTVGGPGITLRERPNLSIIQVAAYADTADETGAVIQDIIGALPPPGPNRSIMVESIHICWIGPHKWWIIETDPRHHAESIAGSLGIGAAVTTQGHGRSCIRLSGPSVRDLLPKGCTLDFHPLRFSAGHCAQTSLGHTNALINCIDDEPIFDLYVLRSYAVSFWEWITDAAGEFGYKVISRNTDET
jgi:sarcosine oxidase subunit gamma